MNQLVRVNEVGGSTYVYEYDNAGNITSKKEYLYTTDAVILDEPENESNYTYDSVWKDRLSRIDNTMLSYDDIGNPTSIGNDTLTWEGRTLKSYTKGNESYNYSYDENGLRHRKTVSVNNVVTETYNYVWSDGKLISQEYSDGNTSYAAKFVYSSSGDVQGFIYDDTTYLYVRNLQGDIVAIVDELGREAMKMSYDAWGCIGYSVGSLNNTTLFNIIKHLSPFTYRGYCYDTDIELYYLQSRYYSPAIGRFINTDDTNIAIATQGSVLGANLFAYCVNNPVINTDSIGLLADVFSATVVLIVVLATMITYFAFMAIWSYVATVYGKELGEIMAGLWGKSMGYIKRQLLIKGLKLLALYEFLQLIRDATKADTEIRRTVKTSKNAKYWTAKLVRKTYVQIGVPITFEQAIKEVTVGRSIFCASYLHARAVALIVGHGLPPMEHMPHRNCIGYYKHLHVYGHPNGAHLWYL